MPALWALVESHGWTNTQLAEAIGEDDGNVTRLLYGDRKASRVVAVKLMPLGVAIDLWDQPLPAGWLPPHVSAERTGPLPRVTSAAADALTGT
jgi:hypothetical protein